MRDLTRDELIEAITPAAGFFAFDADDIEIAIYWFANYWHGGQDSNLYHVLCTSPYTPGPMARLETEGETVQMILKALEATFVKIDPNRGRKYT